MGYIIGSVGLVLGLLFLIFPKFMMNIFRFRGQGFHKKKGKTKYELFQKPADKVIGEKKAIWLYRIFGIICLILSVFAFLSDSAL